MTEESSEDVLSYQGCILLFKGCVHSVYWSECWKGVTGALEWSAGLECSTEVLEYRSGPEIAVETLGVETTAIKSLADSTSYFFARTSISTKAASLLVIQVLGSSTSP